MKTSLTTLLLLLLAHMPAVFAQNWAPFQVNKKILYSTPDTLEGMLVGKSIALTRFDTVVVHGDTTTYFCPDIVDPEVPPYSYPLKPKSYVSLYGSKMVKRENLYWFFPHTSNFMGPYGDTVVYNPKAEPGMFAIQSPVWKGFVSEKIFRMVNGQPDSVKLIQLTETPNSGPSVLYSIELSKNRGFLSLPDLYIGNWTSDQKPLYTYFADLDQDLLGIKSYKKWFSPFKEGDVLTYVYNYDYHISMNYSFCYTDSVKRTTTAVSGDSCWISDTTKRRHCQTGLEEIISSQKKYGTLLYEPSRETPYIQSEVRWATSFL